MMQSRPWLPDGTQPPSALRSALAEVVAGWAARWFAVAPPVLQPLVRGATGGMAWRDRDGVMLGITAGGMTSVGARMLDVPATDRAESDGDLLDHVAEPCLDDLRATLVQGFGERGDWRPALVQPAWSATVGTVPAPVAIGLSADRFALLVRRYLTRLAPVPLGSGAAALAAQPIIVGAIAGRVTLNVADLAALVPGDVVLLDTPITAALPLAIDGGALPHGEVRVVAADPAPFLRIVTPLAERVSR